VLSLFVQGTLAPPVRHDLPAAPAPVATVCGQRNACHLFGLVAGGCLRFSPIMAAGYNPGPARLKWHNNFAKKMMLAMLIHLNSTLRLLFISAPMATTTGKKKSPPTTRRGTFKARCKQSRIQPTFYSTSMNTIRPTPYCPATGPAGEDTRAWDLSELFFPAPACANPANS